FSTSASTSPSARVCTAPPTPTDTRGPFPRGRCASAWALRRRKRTCAGRPRPWTRSPGADEVAGAAPRRARTFRERRGMTSVRGLAWRECGATYEVEARAICEECFGPLEVTYDYGRIGRGFDRAAVAGRGRSMWRYRELLPIDGDDILGREVGFTPLV